jgi:hypothetical protein
MHRYCLLLGYSPPSGGEQGVIPGGLVQRPGESTLLILGVLFIAEGD